ncbi:MAG: hypothetical protein PVG71_10660 [Anaerolineae bacterium]
MRVTLGALVGVAAGRLVAGSVRVGDWVGVGEAGLTGLMDGEGVT